MYLWTTVLCTALSASVRIQDKPNQSDAFFHGDIKYRTDECNMVTSGAFEDSPTLSCVPSVFPGSLEVCPSPRIIPPSPTCAEKELPWKSGQGDLAVYVSSETTKIVPVDMQTGWNQSISSLESLASPPCTQPPTLTRLPPHPLVTEEPQVPLDLSSDPRSSFAFPPSLAKAGRSRSESSADIPQQQELQPLMGHKGHTHLSPGTANSHWCIQFNRGGRL